MVAYKQQKLLYLTILEADKSKIEALANLVSGEPTSQFMYMGAFMLYPHKMKELRDLHKVPFIRALIPLRRTPPSLPNHFPKTSLSILPHWGLGFNIKLQVRGGQYGLLGGHKNIQSMASFIKLKTFLCERNC